MYHPTTSPGSFIVDPQRDGINNALWFEVDPTIAVSGGKFRFNSAEGLIRADQRFGRYEFAVTFPTTGVQTPTNLNADVEFGLKNLSLGNFGKISILADKSEDNLAFTTYDNFGTAQTTTVTWRAAWNNALTVFIVEWYNDRIRLLVLAASATVPDVLVEHTTSVGKYPLNPFIKASGNDNFDVSFVAVINAHQSNIMLI